MASGTVASAFRTWLEANWTTTPIQWENETFDRPVPTAYPTTPAAFLVVEFSGNRYEQASLGSGSPAAERWVETGAVMIYCLVQAGAGALLAHQYVETLATALRGVVLPGTIRVEGMSLGDGGPGDEDGNWWQLPLRVEWRRG